MGITMVLEESNIEEFLKALLIAPNSTFVAVDTSNKLFDWYYYKTSEGTFSWIEVPKNTVPKLESYYEEREYTYTLTKSDLYEFIEWGYELKLLTTVPNVSEEDLWE